MCLICLIRKESRAIKKWVPCLLYIFCWERYAYHCWLPTKKNQKKSWNSTCSRFNVFTVTFRSSYLLSKSFSDNSVLTNYFCLFALTPWHYFLIFLYFNTYKHTFLFYLHELSVLTECLEIRRIFFTVFVSHMEYFSTESLAEWNTF
jgi:hypothetical protein